MMKTISSHEFSYGRRLKFIMSSSEDFKYIYHSWELGKRKYVAECET